MSKNVTPLASRLRKSAEDAHPSFGALLSEAADEIDMLQSLCDSYSDHIATTALYVDSLREQVAAL